MTISTVRGPQPRGAAGLAPHLIAGGLALVYAWLMSNTRLVTTGAEFVSPLAVILAAHLIWMASIGGLTRGFARVAAGRALTTAFCLAACVGLLAIFAPSPSDAAESLGVQFVGAAFWLGCLAVVCGVIAAAATLIYGGFLAMIWIVAQIRRWLGRPPGSDGGRLNDFGYIVLAFLALGLTSLEGIVPALTTMAAGNAASTIAVAAPPERVWREVAKATSPAFPLPALLRSIPQPVAVLVDEGAELGARRIVHFKGREGEGDLVLKVTRRTATEVTFEAQSDSSPIAGWVRQKSLTFKVEPGGTGSLLTVTSDYDRLLAPAWFFKPYIKLAAYLAVDVLARDTRQRAESSK